MQEARDARTHTHAHAEGRNVYAPDMHMTVHVLVLINPDS